MDVSLGATRTLGLRPWDGITDPKTAKATHEWELAHGSVMVMTTKANGAPFPTNKGGPRAAWQHTLLPEKGHVGPRISIVMRHIKTTMTREEVQETIDKKDAASRGEVRGPRDCLCIPESAIVALR